MLIDEGVKGFLITRPAHGQRIAFKFASIEDVQRAAQIYGDVVGDIDQRRDRPQSDGAQPVLRPFRARSVSKPAKMAANHIGTRIAIIGDRPGNGTVIGAFHRLRAGERL